MPAPRRLRVGIIGAGEVAQVIHIPTLQMLSHLYIVNAICDVSQKTVEHCAEKFRISKLTIRPDEIFKDKGIDVVFILTSDEYYTIAALQAGKHVMLEKPMTLSLPSAKKIIEAEKAANGPKVFVGYMHRCAPSFVEAFKSEVANQAPFRRSSQTFRQDPTIPGQSF